MNNCPCETCVNGEEYEVYVHYTVTDYYLFALTFMVGLVAGVTICKLIGQNVITVKKKIQYIGKLNREELSS